MATRHLSALQQGARDPNFILRKNLGKKKTMSVVVAKPAVSLLSGVQSVLSAIAGVFVSIAAAGAVANAVENHRAPRAADLRVLGLENVDFKKYY